ncbi:MAG TPA: chalcone isomerase family protein [Candidatus Binatia bacterium]|nr:chalcone isomerase family protein [Candidatus Binatia bacterium]
MARSIRGVAAAFVLTLALTPIASARTLAGVTLPNSVRAGGARLVLNGSAVYRKFGFKVLVAGLYLPARERDARLILGANRSRRYVSHFVRDVSAKQIRNAWRKGLRENTPGVSEEVQRQYQVLYSWLVDMKPGQEIVFSYRPGFGSSIEIGGRPVGRLPGKAVADAYFAMALGPKPACGESFKRQLLGL